ncbi:energy transducer TonB [Chryseobacterium sp. GMJ5]|uniref:Energy transducer TonB n=1 Tax=Chryseobacterium gilvum TaxID=2976534 RepID=A0ABT2VT13_9FLAO|nr:energy transducer TonB [Chryseobacterium gilvum]MCU7613126.1 energy transducer TonB [Chryseobacterium gilvum]
MKHLQSNQDFYFNEILFEGRNKQYGAYVLRNESDRILTKALFIGVSLLATISITPLIINTFKSNNTNTIICTYPAPIVLDNVDIPDNPRVVLPPKITTSPAVKTMDYRLPEPTANPVTEKVVKKIEGAVAGVKDQPTGVIAPSNTYVPPTTIPGKGTVVNQIQPPVNVVTKDPKAIDNFPAVQADFEGGINSFRNKVMNKFDTSAFEDGGSVATVVTFIVETDGTISDIKTNGKDATFNAEALRTIKAVKGKWIPGKNKNGEAVRSYFKFPISMKFDN